MLSKIVEFIVVCLIFATAVIGCGIFAGLFAAAAILIVRLFNGV